MEDVQHVRKTDLARKTRQVIDTVQRGQTVIIESYGQPEAAIVDIIDYRILRAVLRYHAEPLDIDAESGLPDERVEALDDIQQRYSLVIAHYLAGAISLGRAAELLGLASLDLRMRFVRLDVPLRTAPATVEEAKQDVETIRAWTEA